MCFLTRCSQNIRKSRPDIVSMGGARCHVQSARKFFAALFARLPGSWRVSCVFVHRMHSQDADDLYIIMPFLRGGDLDYFLESKGALSEDMARFYGAEAILAMEELHNLGYIYRDLKPQNLLLHVTAALSAFVTARFAGIWALGAVRLRFMRATNGGRRLENARNIRNHRLPGTRGRRGRLLWLCSRLFQVCLLFDWLVLMAVVLLQLWRDHVRVDGAVLSHVRQKRRRFRPQNQLAGTLNNSLHTHKHTRSHCLMQNLSPTAVDLIRQLIHLNPAKRLGCRLKVTRETVTEHPVAAAPAAAAAQPQAASVSA